MSKEVEKKVWAYSYVLDNLKTGKFLHVLGLVIARNKNEALGMVVAEIQQKYPECMISGILVHCTTDFS